MTLRLENTRVRVLKCWHHLARSNVYHLVSRIDMHGMRSEVYQEKLSQLKAVLTALVLTGPCVICSMISNPLHLSIMPKSCRDYPTIASRLSTLCAFKSDSMCIYVFDSPQKVADVEVQAEEPKVLPGAKEEFSGYNQC